MVKHTQTIRQQQHVCLSVFDHFLGLVLKVLKMLLDAPILGEWKTKERYRYFRLLVMKFSLLELKKSKVSPYWINP